MSKIKRIFRGLDFFSLNSLVPIGLALITAVFQPPRSPCPCDGWLQLSLLAGLLSFTSCTGSSSSFLVSRNNQIAAASWASYWLGVNLQIEHSSCSDGVFGGQHLLFIISAMTLSLSCLPLEVTTALNTVLVFKLVSLGIFCLLSLLMRAILNSFFLLLHICNFDQVCAAMAFHQWNCFNFLCQSKTHF